MIKSFCKLIPVGMIQFIKDNFHQTKEESTAQATQMEEVQHALGATTADLYALSQAAQQAGVNVRAFLEDLLKIGNLQYSAGNKDTEAIGIAQALDLKPVDLQKDWKSFLLKVADGFHRLSGSQAYAVGQRLKLDDSVVRFLQEGGVRVASSASRNRKAGNAAQAEDHIWTEVDKALDDASSVGKPLAALLAKGMLPQWKAYGTLGRESTHALRGESVDFGGLLKAVNMLLNPLEPWKNAFSETRPSSVKQADEEQKRRKDEADIQEGRKVCGSLAWEPINGKDAFSVEGYTISMPESRPGAPAFMASSASTWEEYGTTRAGNAPGFYSDSADSLSTLLSPVPGTLSDCLNAVNDIRDILAAMRSLGPDGLGLDPVSVVDAMSPVAMGPTRGDTYVDQRLTVNQQLPPDADAPAYASMAAATIGGSTLEALALQESSGVWG